MSAPATPAPKNPERNRARLILIAGIVIAVLAIGAIASMVAGGGGSTPGGAAPAATSPAGGSETAAPQQTEDAEAQRRAIADQLPRRQDGDPLAVGAVDAPIVMIEYADFTCTYCGLFATETLPEIKEKYVDTGVLRIEWRDLPILSQASVDTAVAGRAAAAQGKFWEYYNAMYAHTNAKGSHDRDGILQVASTIPGLDVAAFATALDDPAIVQAVQTEGSESRGLGLTSTPTFVLDGYLVQGAQPKEYFHQIMGQLMTEHGVAG